MNDPWFDTCPERRGTWSEKWEHFPEDILPLWVADMDFRSPEPVIAALHERVEHGIFGYTEAPRALAEAIAAHQASAHGWQVDPDWIVFLPGLGVGLHACARTLHPEGGEALIPTPIYPPFLDAPVRAGARVIRVPLAEPGSCWTIDREALEQMTTPAASSLWLCQPQNPTGRVLTEAELGIYAEHARRHDLAVVSDEVWGDLVLDPAVRHRPFLSVAPDRAERTIVLTAPSKTWNLPGLGCAAAIVPGAELRGRLRRTMAGIVPWVNTLGLTAALAAYRSGGPWLARLRDYLRGNRARVGEALSELPTLRWIPPEATYLAWIDVRGSGLAEPGKHCQEHGLGLSDGRYFAGKGFLRLNFACPRSRLDEALTRLRAAFPA